MPRFRIIATSHKRMRIVQTIVLAVSTTTLVAPSETPGTNQVRLTDGVGALRVNASSGHSILQFPNPSTIQMASGGQFEIPLKNIGTVALLLKDHTGANLGGVTPGGTAVIALRSGATAPATRPASAICRVASRIS